MEASAQAQSMVPQEQGVVLEQEMPEPKQAMSVEQEHMSPPQVQPVDVVQVVVHWPVTLHPQLSPPQVQGSVVEVQLDAPPQLPSLAQEQTSPPQLQGVTELHGEEQWPVSEHEQMSPPQAQGSGSPESPGSVGSDSVSCVSDQLLTPSPSQSSFHAWPSPSESPTRGVPAGVVPDSPESAT